MTDQPLARARLSDQQDSGAVRFDKCTEEAGFAKVRGLLWLSISGLLLAGLLITLPIIIKPSHQSAGHVHDVAKFSTQR
jgi:hypothetical protein